MKTVRRSLTSIALLAGAFASLTGCSSLMTLKYGGLYYTAQKDATLRLDLPTQTPKALEPSVRQAIRQKKSTLAFAPPDRCLRSSRSAGLLRCGSIMSRLQNRALRMGFRVVSWKQLKGPKQPIFYARQLKVDYLFEVHEMGENTKRFGRVIATRLRFTRSTRPDGKGGSSLEVEPQVALRCKRHLERKQKVVLRRSTVSLSVNMVDVQSARVLWGYKKELGLHQRSTWSHRVKETWVARKAGVLKGKVENSLMTAGVTMIVLGGGTGGAFLLISGAQKGERAFDVIGLSLLPASIVAGFVMVLVGRARGPKKKNRLKAPAPLTPDRALCRAPGLAATPHGKAGKKPPLSQGQSSYNFIERTAPVNDPQHRRKIDAVMGKIMDDFFGHLK